VAAASVAAGHVSRSTLAALRLSFCDGGGGAAPSSSGRGAAVGPTGASSASGSLARALAALPGQLLSSWDGREALVDALMGPLLYKVRAPGETARTSDNPPPPVGCMVPHCPCLCRVSLTVRARHPFDAAEEDP
jgi:hypothetical protein